MINLIFYLISLLLKILKNKVGVYLCILFIWNKIFQNCFLFFAFDFFAIRDFSLVKIYCFFASAEPKQRSNRFLRVRNLLFWFLAFTWLCTFHFFTLSFLLWFFHFGFLLLRGVKN
uniref:Uncharacterized protein n=1 Tax=Lacunastrum gracillimum TaxID=427913 RepID=A0A2U8GH93_9CHLO|nr:hypothetical protein [Lacunastrum gracillimum]AWI68066.1 hypothetical protein [Lacunastrum gracillimum]